MTIQHGGRRPNAGRKPIVDKPIRRTVYLDQEHIAVVEGWAALNGLSFSQMIREVIDFQIREHWKSTSGVR